MSGDTDTNEKQVKDNINPQNNKPVKKVFITCLLVAAALLLPTALSAQPASYNGHVVYTWAPYPNEPDTSIVRQWNDDYVISKVHHGTKKYFNTLYTGYFFKHI